MKQQTQGKPWAEWREDKENWMGSISKTKSLPRRGYRTQPRVSTLGTLKINGLP
jgi:hypothetical protein